MDRLIGDLNMLMGKLTQTARAEIAESSRPSPSSNVSPRLRRPVAKHAGLAAKIDHTLLKPDATPADIEKLCEEARQHGFATVCVNSSHVALAARLLKGTQTAAISVVGFPLGACTTSTKVFEAREAIRLGAREIDMVIAIGALKAREYPRVFEDIRQVVEAAGACPVKVILETSLLSDPEKIAGCVLAKAAGARFVKTSTGFSSAGATTEDVALMRAVVGPAMGVKASGGVRTRADAEKMIAAGADRLGTSSGPAIAEGGTPGTIDGNGKRDSY